MVATKVYKSDKFIRIPLVLSMVYSHPILEILKRKPDDDVWQLEMLDLCRVDMPAHTASWIYGEPTAVSNCTHARRSGGMHVVCEIGVVKFSGK